MIMKHLGCINVSMVIYSITVDIDIGQVNKHIDVFEIDHIVNPFLITIICIEHVNLKSILPKKIKPSLSLMKSI